MAGLFQPFVVVAGLVVALMALVLARRGALWASWAALGLGAAALAGVWLAGAEVLGRAKPAALALVERGADSAQMVAALPVEGVAIYLWLVLEGEAAPRAYVLPWSVAAAEAIRAAEAAAEENGTHVMVTDPFAAPDTPGEQFTAPPPPVLPDKVAG